MKAAKIFGKLIMGGAFVCCLSQPTLPAFAIEDLQLSVQSSNVLLSWSSLTNETYLVQYRPTLAATDAWVTLTNDYPAATNANMTFFIHSNSVQYPDDGSGGGTNGGGSPPEPDLAMVLPANGSDAATPLTLYPPGFDLSGMIIFDPATGESVSGNGYSIRSSSVNQAQVDGLQAQDDTSGGTNVTTTGFYRVVQDGVHIYGLTNGMVLSGEVQFPIELALDSTDEIVGLTFYASGSPLIGASSETNANGGWRLDWNTSMMPNGTYDLNAEVDFASDDPVTNFPVTVTVSNAISFPNYFTRIFGDQMWIYAQSVFPDADFEIDLYDENSNLLGYFTGTTDDSGVISFLWNLVDGSGNLTDSTNLTGVFIVSSSGSQDLVQNNQQTNSAGSPALVTLHHPGGVRPLASGASVSAVQTWAREPAWQVGNSWAIAWSPLIVNDVPTTLDINNLMIGGEGGVYGGVVSTLGFYGLDAPMSPGNVSQSAAFEMADTNSRAQFLSYMAQSQYRHFYFFGHGSPYSFGTTGAVITYTDIQHALHNFLNTAEPANYHPYRLVFIDGCQAGQGDLCEAFGISAQTVNNQFFANVHVQSRAFLGFKKTISFNPQQWTWRALMLQGFFNDWMHGNPLSTCVNNAVNGAHESIFEMDSSWVIYGATDLTKNTDTTQQ